MKSKEPVEPQQSITRNVKRGRFVPLPDEPNERHLALTCAKLSVLAFDAELFGFPEYNSITPEGLENVCFIENSVWVRIEWIQAVLHVFAYHWLE